jgi:predicted HicB family RNase H-like nuclease
LLTRIPRQEARADISAHKQLSRVALPRMGLDLPQQIPFEAWLRIGKQLSEINSSSAWCLGDWLVYGIANYEGRYHTAIEQTSLDYQTLRNYAWVAKRFSLSRRRDKLSFGHHSEVTALPAVEQDFWLRKAEALGWSVKHLRREVRASLRERAADAEGQSGPISGAEPSDLQLVRLEIDVSPEQLEKCQAAAEKIGISVSEWVALALENAVHLALVSLTEIFGLRDASLKHGA